MLNSGSMVINRTHALPIPDARLKRLRHALELFIVLFPIVLFFSVGLYTPGVLVGGAWSQLPFWWKPVLFVCCPPGISGLIIFGISSSVLQTTPTTDRTPVGTDPYATEAQSGSDRRGALSLSGWPSLERNFQCRFHSENISAPSSTGELGRSDNLHLSDLHFSGTLKREYFVELCRIAQETKPDLIVFAGDLIDEMKCLDWLG